MSRFEQPSTAVAALGAGVGQHPGPSSAPSMPPPSPRKGGGAAPLARPGTAPTSAPRRPQEAPKTRPKRPQEAPADRPTAESREHVHPTPAPDEHQRQSDRPQNAKKTYTYHNLRPNTGAKPTVRRMQGNIHIPRTLELHRHATTRPTAECTAYIHLLQTPCSDRRQPDRPQNASSHM